MTAPTQPVTLFTGQWADLTLEEVARLASQWGYDDGLQDRGIRRAPRYCSRRGG